MDTPRKCGERSHRHPDAGWWRGYINTEGRSQQSATSTPGHREQKCGWWVLLMILHSEQEFHLSSIQTTKAGVYIRVWGHACLSPTFVPVQVSGTLLLLGLLALLHAARNVKSRQQSQPKGRRLRLELDPSVWPELSSMMPSSLANRSLSPWTYTWGPGEEPFLSCPSGRCENSVQRNNPEKFVTLRRFANGGDPSCCRLPFFARGSSEESRFPRWIYSAQCLTASCLSLQGEGEDAALEATPIYYPTLVLHRWAKEEVSAFYSRVIILMLLIFSISHLPTLFSSKLTSLPVSPNFHQSPEAKEGEQEERQKVRGEVWVPAEDGVGLGGVHLCQAHCYTPTVTHRQLICQLPVSVAHGRSISDQIDGLATIAKRASIMKATIYDNIPKVANKRNSK